MSLKTFHVVFVVVSTLLAVGFGVWAFGHYRQGAGTGYLLTAGGSVLVAGSLVVYGRWFLKKLKDVSYL